MNQSQQIFINEAITNSVLAYLNSKDNKVTTSSLFLNMVMNTLVSIYSELDIINSYKTFNENGLGGFNKNLMKYGYTNGQIELFKKDFQYFYEIETKNNQKAIKDRNPYYFLVQKHLIDMFFKKVKKLSLAEKEINEFYATLYTDDSFNPFIKSYNLLVATNRSAVREYYSFKRYQSQNQIKYTLIKDNLLPQELYDRFAISADIINESTQNQINSINDQIYEFLKSSKDDSELESKINKFIKSKIQPNINIKY